MSSTIKEEKPEKPEKPNKLTKKIPVMEIFGPTIQGEGPVIGQQTYFLRLGLCDYRCTKCDSLHAILPEMVKKNATWLTQEEIFDAYCQYRSSVDGTHKGRTTPWLTLTGGNPCIHDLSHFMDICRDTIKVCVETQGTFMPKWLIHANQIVISPKGPGMGYNEFDPTSVIEFLRAYPFMMEFTAIKVVVMDQRDLEFAKEIHAGLRAYISQDNFYLSLGNEFPPPPTGQPEHDGDELNRLLVRKYRALCDDIMYDATLRHFKFLPQWHVFVFGNGQGH